MRAAPAEIRERIELYVREANETPAAFRWKYKLDTLPVVWFFSSRPIDNHRAAMKT